MTETQALTQPEATDGSETVLAQDPGWNERRAATILGFEDQELSTANAEIPLIKASAGNDLPDPREHPVSPSLGNNPIAKVGLVGGVSLAAFILVGFIFSSMTTMSLKSSSVQSSSVAANSSEILNFTENAASEQQQAVLLTESALSKQEKQLAALSDPKLTRRDNKSPSEAETTRPGTVAKGPIAPIAPAPVTLPIPVTPLPAPASVRTLPNPIESPSSVGVQPVDPMQQWQTASTIGSYTPGPNLLTAAPPTAPHTATVIETQPFPTPPTVVMPSTATQSTVIPDQSNTINPVEEAAILNGRPVRFLAIGTRVAGRLLTPIQREEEAIPQNSAQAAPLRLIVRLEAPLLNPSGQVALPAGTDVIAEVLSVGQSGLVTMTAISIVTEGVEYHLPAHAITIRGQQGYPLMARRLNDPGAEIAGLDTALVLFGGLSKVGELINRPQSTTLITGLGSTTTTVQNSSPDVMAALMQGGFGGLTQQLETRNQQALQSAMSRSALWLLEPGTPVEVFVNQTLQL
ncbi:hypothetical protein BST81_12810 [Leptolyngbya sp. 'hensonii']|uniref:TrbI/VirB10 family protein n=1 Tax=Leptolyngbya sp. 'hensonii' TaxID=1922337 RepID=UPI00094F9938|nr:TrbI/VirB10 family protein [Leptolyngbya sp. 'hensonii']OLP17931.1 hypothetical protein BST81_12810 [Leptolyngbya sp. 'hensonii']